VLAASAATVPVCTSIRSMSANAIAPVVPSVPVSASTALSSVTPPVLSVPSAMTVGASLVPVIVTVTV